MAKPTTKAKVAEIDGDEVLTAIWRIEALVASARNFDECRKSQENADAHFCVTLEMIEDQLKGLKRALWGEKMSP